MIAVWDLETFGLCGDIALGCAYDGSKHFFFSDFAEFFEKLSGWDDGKIIFYAHNSGRYDNRYLFEFLQKCGKETKLSNFKLINNSIIFSVKYKGKSMEFRDSFKLLPSSLESIANAFGVKHKKTRYNDYERHANRSKLEEYVLNDCICLFECITMLSEKLSPFGLKPEKKLTLPSLSLDFLLSFNGCVKKCRNFFKKEDEDWVRKALHGGRSEVFSVFGENLNYYDVNSMYPSVMHDCEYGFGKKLFFHDDRKISNFIEWGYTGLVEGKVKAPYLSIPLLHHSAKKQRLIFPYGKFEGIFTTEEIAKAVRLGYEFEFTKGMFYEHKEPLFREYVKTLYPLKSENRGAIREIGKLLLNSSWGKFGQRREHDKFFTLEEMMALKEPLQYYEEVTPSLFLAAKLSYSNRKINPYYACAISANARLRLYEAFERCDLNVHYCDTDSILSESSLPEDMIHEKALGKWKLIQKVDEAVFLAPKTYAFRTEGEVRIKCKGIPSSALVNISFEDMRSLALTRKSRNLTFNAICGFLEKRKRMDTRTRKEEMLIISKTKTLRMTREKRIYLQDGSTEPYRVEE